METENIDYGNMSSEEAGAQIDLVMNDASHLYHSPPATPGRQAAIDHIGNLYLVKHDEFNLSNSYGLPAKQVSAPADSAGAGYDPAATQEEAGNSYNLATHTQEDLVGEAEGEMARLVALGFDEDFIPGDIAPYQVRGLKEQRLHAEATDEGSVNSWRQLGLMLAEDYKELGGDAAGRGMLTQFFNATGPDNKLGTEIAHTITKHIYNLKKRG